MKRYLLPLLALCLTPRAHAAIADPPPSKIRELWVVNAEPLPQAEQVLAQTIQGLANRRQPRVWLRGKSFYAIVENQLKREGVKLSEASPWELARRFRGEIKGAIVYKLGTPSLNVATSLCGIMDGVAIDESLLPQARAQGLQVLADARGMDDQAAWQKYGARFARGAIVEQSLDKPGQMRDLPVALKAFTFSTRDSAFRTQVARAAGPNAIAYGWGPDEFEWIHDLSLAGATGAPSDWSTNLSALRFLPAGKLRRPKRPAIKAEPNVRYVAFVMSDGDNLQWLTNSFVDNASFWASPVRGTLPMTWELSPLMSRDAPRVLQYVYATATPQDAFIAGAGAPGYTYLHQQPNRAALAKQSAPYLRDSDLPIVSTLNDNAGRLEETAELLDLPNVSGVIYKDYAPYNRSAGKIFWRNGKPCLSYKFVLWEKLMEPEQLAEQVGKMPTAPLADESSYALVNVHAWSYGKAGGPMEAVRRAAAMLPPNTRVVTADQIMQMLSDNFGARHKAR